MRIMILYIGRTSIFRICIILLFCNSVDVGFSQHEIVTDIDGNIYPTVTICGQQWMAENLRTTKFDNEIPIPRITERWDWVDRTIPGMCGYNYTTDIDTISKYGLLYNWYTVNMDNLCPSGWHVPSDEDWKKLESCLCMSQTERDALGSRGNYQGSQIAGDTTLWIDGDLEAGEYFGTTGFMALPAGYVSSEGIFYDLGAGARFWTSSEVDYSQALFRYLRNTESTLGRQISEKGHGRSVRCINSNASGNGIYECYEVLLSGESIVCQGEQHIIYKATSDANISEYIWQYSGTGAIINGNSESVSIDFSETATSGILSVSVSGDGLTPKSFEFPIIINPLPDAAGNISGESNACRDTSGYFYSVPEVGHSTGYQWDYSGMGASFSGNSESIYINFTPGATSGILTVRGINACGEGKTSSEMKIDLKLCNDTTSQPTFLLNIPNSFSPNGDGINDLFLIRGLPGGSALMIFDRQGKKVYETTNYQNNWGGADDEGHLLETGTYWYIIVVPGFSQSFKGFVYLKR